LGKGYGKYNIAKLFPDCCSEKAAPKGGLIPSMNRPLKCDGVVFHEFGHFGNPTPFDKGDVQWVDVVGIKGRLIHEKHRHSKDIGVLRARLAGDLKLLDPRDRLQTGQRSKEIGLKHFAFNLQHIRHGRCISGIRRG
jgi:hypothetical protein